MIVGKQKYNNTLSQQQQNLQDWTIFWRAICDRILLFYKLSTFGSFLPKKDPCPRDFCHQFIIILQSNPNLTFSKGLTPKFSNSYILLKAFSLPKTCGTPLGSHEHFFQNITVLALFACLTYPMVFHICSTSWNSSVKSCYGRVHHYCPKLPPKVCLVEDPLITKHFKQISSVFGQHTISMNIPPRIEKGHMLTLHVMSGREIMPASV